jgi:hypothetical protein
MALIGNGNRILGANRCRYGGGSATNTYVDAPTRQVSYLNQTIDKKSGIPSGTNPPGSYCLPIKAGGLASFTLMKSSVTFIGTPQVALNLFGAIEGTGSFTTAELGIISYLVLSMTGSGSFTSSQISLVTDLTATINASGTFTTAQLGIIVNILVDMDASGNFAALANTLVNISLSFGGPATLSPEGLAQAVWNYLKANPTTTGSMKEVMEKVKANTDLIPATL